MGRQSNETLWHQLTLEVQTGMREWRLQHPKATLRQIETELDARLNHVRARLLEDLALQSAATVWEDTPLLQQPTCPDCGARLLDRGSQSRTLQTHGGQDLTLERHYGECPVCGTGLFPPR
jgi:YgiT-type zinc finger domain-containing protein